MIVGIDFDNTVVCYDALFHKVALEWGLIPEAVLATKGGVRDFLRSVGKEKKWIELQGYVYGARMNEAVAFPGVMDFLASLKKEGHQVRIISHKTLQPFDGPSYNLHEVSHEWLKANGFYKTSHTGLSRNEVFFETTKQGKIGRLSKEACDIFIDDLPEFLNEPGFPKSIERILFDPGNRYADEHRFKHFESWSALKYWILLTAHASAVAKQAGLDGCAELVSIDGGANNKVFRFEAGKNRFLFKVYFQDPEDVRNRLQSEYSFLKYAWDIGLRSIPQPFAFNAQFSSALYEFIEGRLLDASEVSDHYVGQATDFFLGLNRRRNSEAASALADASDACFSIQDHLNSVEQRIQRFLSFKVVSEVDREASDFINGDLLETWKRISKGVRRDTSRLGWDVQQSIPQEERCLSPSDFGFHNALLESNGRLRFIDFEYAGWDDPAKMVCDFFCQEKVPVSMDHIDHFIRAVFTGSPDPERGRRRAFLLLPLHSVKWCCIMLNDFLQLGGVRRQFAAPIVNDEQRKKTQLEKSRASLRRAQKAVLHGVR